jgi:hypothetical protein
MGSTRYGAAGRADPLAHRPSVSMSKTAKGCLSFALLFVLGIGIMLGGLIPDMMSGPAELGTGDGGADRSTSRILEVSGLALAFGAIYGAAAWQFARRKRPTSDDANQP